MAQNFLIKLRKKSYNLLMLQLLWLRFKIKIVLYKTVNLTALITFLRRRSQLFSSLEGNMMSIISIVNILKNCKTMIGKEVTVCGWVRSRRDSKIGISFLSVYDGSCFSSIQIIIDNTLPNYNNDVLHLTTGCSVNIFGKVKASLGEKQTVEIHAINIKVIGWITNPDTYPMSAKYHNVKYLREMVHLRPRTNLIGAISRIRHTLSQALHRFFDEHGYFFVSTPLITSINAEGAGKMFRVSTLDMENLPRTPKGKIDYTQDFFGKESFLTVSGQLNGETYACALSKIYTFGPTFRAEKSNTSRHLAEFWMIEPEVAFANLDDIIDLAENMLKYVFKKVLEDREDDMNYFSKYTKKNITYRLENCVSENFAKIDYTNAISILKRYEKKFKDPVYWGIDLSSEHERYLTEKYFQVPVVVKNYPKDIKAFYMRLNEDGKTVAAMDIITTEGGEIIGGSQREERLEMLDARMTEMGLNKNDYWWYRDLRRYGTVPHSGFGLGFERLISYVTGISNIRDIIPFPRALHNLLL